MIDIKLLWIVIGSILAIFIVFGILGSICLFIQKVWEHINLPQPSFIMRQKFVPRALSDKEVMAITKWYEKGADICGITLKQNREEGLLVSGGYYITEGWTIDKLLENKDYKATLIKLED